MPITTSNRRTSAGYVPLTFVLALEVAVLALVGSVVLANVLTSTYGLVPAVLGIAATSGGLVTTAGTFAAGLAFVARDTLHDLGGWWAVAVAVAVGILLSYLLADPRIAVASAVAFGASELADSLVYAPLRERRGYVPAALASNTVGALVDTLLFLWVAGFPVVGEAVAGQMVAKLLVTVVAVSAALGLAHGVRHGRYVRDKRARGFERG